MEIIYTIAALRARLKSETSIGFVPTMGNLHAGHIDLTRIAREHVGGGMVVVSIFVNRLQFGPKEDFGKYPRTFAEDCDKCREAGVDIVFAPDDGEMYPEAQRYVVEPAEIQNILDGAVRPGHFRGVATVVTKLFNIVRPTIAVFGKKDYQQCRVLDNMVRQLAMPIALIFGETVRAPDGLALSSRNGYLSTSEREEAPQLSATLRNIKRAIEAGVTDFEKLEADAIATLTARGWRPDYVTVRRQSDLLVPEAADRALVVLGAARLGTTRLIDNLEIARHT
jgi:pantoate--beta-alanine ligase